MGRQPFEEILDAALLEPRRDQTLYLNVRHLERQAHLAAKDDQLSRDIHTGEVIPRVGLCVAALLGLTDDVAERTTAVIDIKEIRERP